MGSFPFGIIPRWLQFGLALHLHRTCWNNYSKRNCLAVPKKGPLTKFVKGVHGKN